MFWYLMVIIDKILEEFIMIIVLLWVNCDVIRKVEIVI